FTVTGRVDGQVCKTACIQFDSSFVFTIGNLKDVEKVTAVLPPPVDTATAQTEKQSSPVTADTGASVTTNSVPTDKTLEPGCGVAEDGTTDAVDKSYLGIFIAGMLGGLLA